MTKISGLVKKVSPETWPFVGMMLVGLAITTLATFKVFGVVLLSIAMWVMVILVSLAVVKIRSKRITKDVPARIKVAYFTNKVVLTTILAGIIIIVIMMGLPATLILAGIPIWLISDLVSLSFIRRYPAIKKSYMSQLRNHS